jgi:hypothetical protein
MRLTAELTVRAVDLFVYNGVPHLVNGEALALAVQTALDEHFRATHNDDRLWESCGEGRVRVHAGTTRLRFWKGYTTVRPVPEECPMTADDLKQLLDEDLFEALLAIDDAGVVLRQRGREKPQCSVSPSTTAEPVSPGTCATSPST